MRRCLVCGVRLHLTVVYHCPGASAVNIMDRANDTKIDKCKIKVLEWGNILYTLLQEMESSLVLKSGGQLLRAFLGGGQKNYCKLRRD